MARFAAFLRAVNVGGTGKLPMADLKAICEALGFKAVQTYIASGNVVFETNLDAAKCKTKLELRLAEYLGKSLQVFLRDAIELERIISASPFTHADGNRLLVIILDHALLVEMITGAKFRVDEEVAVGDRCLYVHYPSGMGKSKLKLPGAELGTARNMNTIRKMLELIRG